jgi:N-methylhydantoinase B
LALDPITLEVLNNRLRETISAMDYLLFHSGYSTILRESYDGSSAICDPQGRLVATSSYPFHLMSYTYSVRAVLERFPLQHMQDGDSFLEADPYLGGMFHVPDQAVTTPVYVDGELIGMCLSLTHKADVGGMAPGSSSAGAREIWHEGLLLPPVRYWTRDGVVRDIESIVKRNSRTGEALAGDLRAQVGCTRVGADRLRGLCAEYGTDTMKEAFSELQDLSEQRVRRGLAAWPDGEAEAESWVDHDGVDLDTPLRLHVRVTKRGDQIALDYSQMHPQVKGPINLRPQASEMAGAMAVLTFLDPSIPMNYGFLRPITFVNPEGTITHARWPAPVNNYFGLTALVYSTILKALAQFNPGRAVGSAGLGQSGISVGYRQTRAGRQGVQYEILATSLGGTPAHDGVSPVLTMAHLTPNTAVEVLETEYPVRVRCHQWLADSAGPGRYRGGLGYRKEYEVLADATFTLRMAHQFANPGWGVLGGKGAPAARAFANRGTEREQAVGPLVTREARAGETFCVELPGGGGYGDPLQREPELVLLDVLDRLVSVECAREDYGVVITNGKLDREATDRLRARIRGASEQRDAPPDPAER